MNLSRNGKWGLAAVMAVALVAAGAAFAATKIHTGGQANAMGRFGGGPGQAPRGYGFGRPDGGPAGDLSAAATYLGIDTSTLFQDLRSGKTLAQIADATSGKSASGLIDALVAAEQSRFRGTAAQLKARITAMVNGTGFGFRGGGGGRGFGPGGGGGSAPAPPPRI
jgi:hypothetical protein